MGWDPKAAPSKHVSTRLLELRHFLGNLESPTEICHIFNQDIPEHQSITFPTAKHHHRAPSSINYLFLLLFPSKATTSRNLTQLPSPHTISHCSLKMSDYGDDMDVDGPPAVSVIPESTKGKRSAANLPVEAEDSLPWFVNQIQMNSSLLQASRKLTPSITGSRNTDQQPYQTSPATRTSSQP